MLELQDSKDEGSEIEIPFPHKILDPADNCYKGYCYVCNSCFEFETTEEYLEHFKSETHKKNVRDCEEIPSIDDIIGELDAMN